jgi:NAD(P)-dependent dehydrogenase (short-subunit alcohol dehydrogenase family)
MACGIVTGCGKGIGLATTAQLLKKGDTVIGISRSVTPGIKGLRKRFRDQFEFSECDISDLESYQDVLRKAISDHCRIDYAIGNAGVRSRVSVKDAEIQRYRDVIEINTVSQVLMAKVMIEAAIQRSHHLNLLYVTSIVGPRGFEDLTTYACSKSALEGFVRSAAVEHAKQGIRINCIAPGFVRSSYHQDFARKRKDLHQWTLERTPMGRWGTCHEIAHLACFLVSKANSYMTGTTVYCDGGWSAA